MNYGDAETEIVNRLTGYIAIVGKTEFYNVALAPENEAQFKEYESKFGIARATVQYVDSDYSGNNSSGIICQEETVKFRVQFEFRKLRGDGGLYGFIEITKRALLGWRMQHADKLEISGFGNFEMEPNVWAPWLEFKCKTLNVQSHNEDDEVIGGPLQGITFLNNDEEFSPSVSDEFNQLFFE